MDSFITWHLNYFSFNTMPYLIDIAQIFGIGFFSPEDTKLNLLSRINLLFSSGNLYYRYTQRILKFLNPYFFDPKYLDQNSPNTWKKQALTGVESLIITWL